MTSNLRHLSPSYPPSLPSPPRPHGGGSALALMVWAVPPRGPTAGWRPSRFGRFRCPREISILNISSCPFPILLLGKRLALHRAARHGLSWVADCLHAASMIQWRRPRRPGRVNHTHTYENCSGFVFQAVHALHSHVAHVSKMVSECFARVRNGPAG